MTPFEQGKQAFDEDLYPSDNPYEYANDDYMQWERGWLSAYDDYIDARIQDRGTPVEAQMLLVVFLGVAFCFLMILVEWPRS